jgi:hypothetical protein
MRRFGIDYVKITSCLNCSLCEDASSGVGKPSSHPSVTHRYLEFRSSDMKNWIIDNSIIFQNYANLPELFPSFVSLNTHCDFRST